MNLWFCGTGAFAARCLRRLKEHGLEVQLAITQPPTRKGRGLKEVPSPFETAALELDIPLVRTVCLNDDIQLKARLTDCRPDLMLVVDFGQKVLEPWLSGPVRGCLNIHPSLLPRWRGAAPVPRSLMAGERETGVTLFSLVEAMDAGDIWCQVKEAVRSDDDAGSLLARLADRGSSLLAEGLEDLVSGRAVFTPQEESQVTYAPKIEKAECRLDWGQPACQSVCLVKALSPNVGAWFEMKGERVKVWRAAALPEEGRLLPGQLAVVDRVVVVKTVDGLLRLDRVQPAGKKEMDGVQWAQGLRLEGAVQL